MPKHKTLDNIFFFLSSEERRDVDELAQRLEWSKSDAVRVALRRAIDGIRRVKTDDEEQTAD